MTLLLEEGSLNVRVQADKNETYKIVGLTDMTDGEIVFLTYAHIEQLMEYINGEESAPDGAAKPRLRTLIGDDDGGEGADEPSGADSSDTSDRLSDGFDRSLEVGGTGDTRGRSPDSGNREGGEGSPGA